MNELELKKMLEQQEERYERKIKENSPLSFLKSGWFLLIAAYAVISFSLNLQRDVENNTEAISRIQENTIVELSKISQSLKTIESESSTDLQLLEERVTQIERDLLIINRNE